MYQHWFWYIEALLRYDLMLFWQLQHQFKLAVQGKISKLHMITFVRFGLKNICANFSEDWTKCVACEAF